MTYAIKRCENVYGTSSCEVIRYDKIVNKQGISQKDNLLNSVLPYVSRKCISGYKRHGCCKCLRLCNPSTSSLETTGDKDINNYCLKPPSYESK